MISATYFDGRSAAAQSVELHIKDDVINLLGKGINLFFTIDQLRLNEPFLAAPSFLELGNGAHIEVASSEGKAALQQALDFQPSQIVRWQQKWVGALIATEVMIGLLLSAYFWGIPKMTEIVVARIPDSVEQQLGAELIPTLENGFFTPSGLSDQRMEQAQKIFDAITPAHPRVPMRLLFRRAPSLGANAVALPGGTIVVTDQMIATITAKTGDLKGDQAIQLAGVFAHEIGHVENKHTLKALLSNSALAVISASLFGDFSAVITAMPVALIHSEYSRNMEAQADEFAIKRFHELGYSTNQMANLFELLHKKSAKDDLGDMPSWMRVATDFSASHPSDEARIQRFRQAAQEQGN